MRERLSNRRPGIVLSVNYEGRRVHIGFGMYPDGRLGELFIGAPKVGSGQHIAGLEGFVTASIALQHGARADELLAALPVDAEGKPEGLLGVALQAWIQYAERVEEAGL